MKVSPQRHNEHNENLANKLASNDFVLPCFFVVTVVPVVVNAF